MDNPNVRARRAGASAFMRSPEPADLDTRFRTLVQSLRAGLFAVSKARPGETFDVEALMQAFGRLRLDVENCVRELVDFGGTVSPRPPGPIRRRATGGRDAPGDLLDHFLGTERRGFD